MANDNITAKMEKELILTEVSPKKLTNPQLESLQQLLRADALIIIDKKAASSSYQEKNKKKLPSLQKRDFLDLNSAKELIKFLREFE